MDVSSYLFYSIIVHILSFHGIIIDVAAIMSFTKPSENHVRPGYFYQAINSFYLGLGVSRHMTFGMSSCFDHMI